MILAGTVAACSDAFGVTLDAYAYADEGGIADDARIHRCRSGAVHVPAALAGIVEGVFGLDDRPQARPHFRLKPVSQAAVTTRAASTAYTPLQLAVAYDFPAAGKGAGQCVAIIELGGGYKASELDAYFTGLGLTPPTIKSRSIDGGRNRPDGNPNSADGEVLLDIEVIGAIAPGATIVVYFAPNTDAGFSTRFPAQSTTPTTVQRWSRSVGVGRNSPGPRKRCAPWMPCPRTPPRSALPSAAPPVMTARQTNVPGSGRRRFACGFSGVVALRACLRWYPARCRRRQAHGERLEPGAQWWRHGRRR